MTVATAYHESGHVVAGHVLLSGWRCGGASIIGDEDRSGFAVVNTRGTDAKLAAQVMLAGGIAERLWLERHALTDPPGDGLDQQRVAKLGLSASDLARLRQKNYEPRRPTLARHPAGQPGAIAPSRLRPERNQPLA